MIMLKSIMGFIRQEFRVLGQQSPQTVPKLAGLLCLTGRQRKHGKTMRPYRSAVIIPHMDCSPPEY